MKILRKAGWRGTSRLRWMIQDTLVGMSPNPAALDQIKNAGLPTGRVKGKNVDSLPYEEVPAFFKALDMDDLEDRAVAFAFLTSIRRETLTEARRGWIESDWIFIPGEFNSRQTRSTTNAVTT